MVKVWLDFRGFDIPDQPQHAIQRSNDRSITFVGEEDYQFYLKKLEDATARNFSVI